MMHGQKNLKKYWNVFKCGAGKRWRGLFGFIL